MRINKWSVLLLLACFSITISTHSTKANEITSENLEENGIGIIELNPDYKNSESDDDSDDDESDTDEDEDDEKSAISKALNASKSLPQRAVTIARKHRVKITIALVIFAFRREIYQAMLHLMGTPKLDPVTGKEMGRQISLSLTSILKIALFVHFITQLQRGNTAGALSAVILAGPNGLLLSRLVTRLLQPESINAYIPPIEQHWTFERINERYEKDVQAYRKAMTTFGRSRSSLEPSTQSPMSLHKVLENFLRPPADVTSGYFNGTSIVVDMTGLDSGVTTLGIIRDQVSYLIETHRLRTTNVENTTAAINSTNVTTSVEISSVDQPETEIIVILESPGGEVGAYGMAAQQILRLRNEPGITLTICVDKIAASGGYMMACCASEGHLFAAPFSTLGSIGVFGSIVNINDALEGWGVKPIVLKAGRNKAPLGLIGPVTEEGKANVQLMIDKTHLAFKRHVATSRPILNESINEIATGDVWLGCDAIDNGLADRLVSSDEYIGERMKDGARVLKLVRHVPKWRFGSPPSSRFPFAALIRQGVDSITTQFHQAFTKVPRDGIELVKSHAATNIHVQAPRHTSGI